MEKIITQVAVPGDTGKQANPRARSNGAQSFSVDMDEAVKNKTGDKAVDAGAVKDAGNDAQANNGHDSKMDDMNEMDKGESAAAGLLIATASVENEATGLLALTGSPRPAGNIQGMSFNSVKAADAAQSVEPENAKDQITEGDTMKHVDDTVINNKNFDPKKLLAADGVLEDAAEAVESKEDSVTASDKAKTAGQERIIRNDFAESSTRQSVSAADESADLQDTKALTAADITLEPTDDRSGTGLGDASGEKKGHYSHAGHRGADVVGVGQPGRQPFSYEAVAVGSELTGSERAEVFEKLSTGVSMTIAKDGGEVKLSLRPDHLGNMNIKLNIEDGKVSARIVVESAAVKDALDADSGVLREVFAKNNLVLDKYTVEIAGGDILQEGSFSGFSGFQDDTREGFLHGRDRARAAVKDSSAAIGLSAGVRVSGIDLFI